ARLAARLGDTAALARLEAVRREVAARVLSGLGSDAARAARRSAWLAGASPEDGTPVGEPSVELRELVRALGERRRLGLLLDRVLDVLLSWTGAERGLMLLRNPRGVLVPRAARNIARDHLARDQIALSQSLAERALATGEPVVAVDAMHELGTSHQSAHALQLRSVLALPLAARGEVVGVAYLDDRMRAGTFGAREVAWAQAVAPVAALAISDAMTEVRLRRAVRRAERTGRELEQLLAQKETALDVAERELARTVGHRPTRHRYPEIVGESEPVRRMLAVVDRVAGTDVPVLLRGESGSGKELVARAIHRHGARAGHPFVSENCGALPETLLESALFGHARGAFTGAYAARVGLFEAAHGGTLFLDEIGEMSLGMQTKLLRVLEDGLVRPVGSERARRVDVRIVAATHRDLERLVAEERFRQDLYYRLDVISIAIPSLRERPTDIPLLVAHLVHKHAGRTIEVTPAALARLQEQPWPGNVRQLENEIRRALVLCDERIDVAHLSLAPVGEPVELGLDVRLRVDRLEASLLSEALRRTSGNQTQAAKLLGLSRFGLHKMMRRLAVPSGR
ncbi:MAG: sigma 54-interacting transcriptional regulator, partial [Myxococcales bacterium]|nr:sigma 54-interacting transcriptional regulator [Myxococcales bacterium]